MARKRGCASHEKGITTSTQSQIACSSNSNNKTQKYRVTIVDRECEDENNAIIQFGLFITSMSLIQLSHLFRRMWIRE
jgi:hypothetical protein